MLSQAVYWTCDLGSPRHHTTMSAHCRRRHIHSLADSAAKLRPKRYLFIPVSLLASFAVYIISRKSTTLNVYSTHSTETCDTLSSSCKYRAYAEARAAISTRTMSSVADVLEKQTKFKFKEPAGQVGLDTAYGEVLREVATRQEVKVILETGTWDGAGSSMALGQGLLDSEGILFTIEAVEEQWIHAQRNLAPFPVRCLLGVGVDTSNFPTVRGIEQVIRETKISAQNEEWRDWLVNEKALADLYPVGLIKPICERYPVHFVHIDGGEFSGVEEFKFVQRYCLDIKFIAMDDVNTFKNAVNYKRLKSDPMWRVYKENLEERHGWAVFTRMK